MKIPCPTRLRRSGSTADSSGKIRTRMTLSRYCHILKDDGKGYDDQPVYQSFLSMILQNVEAAGSWRGMLLRLLLSPFSSPIPRLSLSVLRAVAFLLLLLVLPAVRAQTNVPAAPMKVTSETGPMIDSTRETIAKWVETKQLISKEKSEWSSGREILGDRVRLAEAETASVREKLGEIELAVAEAQKKRDELSAENEKLKATAEKVKARIVVLEKQLRPLLKMFPDPLREKLKPILARFPEDSEKSTASLAERLQNVLGLVDQGNAFNSTITSVKELRTFADGTRAEVTTVYLGLAQAYYTNSEGTLAGVGHPGPEGWVWSPENAQGKQILMAVHMLEGKEKTAAFINLPVKIQ